jgi:four helix bundle protein
VIERLSMPIKSFQDLNIWKEAHKLTLEIYKITNKFPSTETYGLISQIRRASVSVVGNIAEGMGRNTTKELLSFSYIARGSLTEVIYYLILSKDFGYLKEDDFVNLYNRYNGLAKGINVFISKLKNRNFTQPLNH